MPWAWILAIAMMLIGLSPLFALTVMSLVAAIGGCRVHEGFPEPCVIAGQDWGGTLYAMGMSGWAFFLTAPIALAGMVLGIALAVAALIRRARD